MSALPPEELRKLCLRVLEADNEATPGPWKFDCGNLEVEVNKPEEAYHRLPIVQLVTSYDRERTFGDQRLLPVPKDPYDDGDLIELYRTAAPELACAILAFIEKAETLFAAIAHGDEEHRRWLKEALEKHFNGPSPEKSS